MAEDDDKEARATELARTLLSSAGLRARSLGLPAAPAPRVQRRSAVSVEEAFGRLAPVDRAASRARVSRAARLTGRTELLTGHALTQLLASQYGVPAIEPRALTPRPDVLVLLPREVAVAHAVVPLDVAGRVLIVATHDPSNFYVLDAVALFTGFTVDVVVASLPELDELIARSSG